MLSAQDMADLREAHRLGIVGDALFADLGEQARAADARAEAMRANAAREQRQAAALVDLRFSESIARRELEVARLEGGEAAVRKAQLVVAYFERRIAEAVAQPRPVPKPHEPLHEPRIGDVRTEAAEALSLIREVQRVTIDLREVATSSRLVPKTALGELDAQLCLAWDNVAPLSEEAQMTAVSRLLAMKSYDARRLLSARNAEKAAMRYYESLGAQVEDVSVTQLSRGSTSWKDFDIRAGDRCIDVKNARESLNGDGHYVEHSVAKFKLSRESGVRVTIAAVVSPYYKDIERYFSSPQVVTVLGEVDAAQMRSLLDWSRVRFGGRLEVRDPGRASFLPGWLFDFPPAHYPRRQAAVEAAPSLLRRLLDALAYSCEIPGWLWVFSDEPIPNSLPSAGVLRDLRILRDTIGITRRSLYVLALGLALEELERDEPEEAEGKRERVGALAALEQTCRLSSGSVQNQANLSPLGLSDPLAYVRSLIALLSEIVSTLRKRQIDVVGFRLVNPSILQGVRPNGEKMTLLAYCGGWQSRPIRAPCGNTPLSIARHASCPACARLVCDICGHCSERCDECEPRQAAVAQSGAAD